MSRARSGSIQKAMNAMEDHTDVRSGLLPQTKAPKHSFLASVVHSIKSFDWMIDPVVSLKMVIFVISLNALLEAVLKGSHYLSLDLGIFSRRNLMDPFLFISYPLAPIAKDAGTARFDKGPLDLCFLAFYVIVFSFVRQSMVIWVFTPFGKWWGFKTETRITRFTEQAYAVFYWSLSGAFGVYVMSRQDTWWYDTKYFWIDYPHWRMEAVLKYYYLLQFSYWIQQLAVLILQLEKPRVDYRELCIHHAVTIWLIGWSYLINLTHIGVAIFVSMDLPDSALAISKCINYLHFQHTSEVTFVFFLGVWHYMRHYLNILILISVIKEYDLIPEYYRTWQAEAWWQTWLPYGVSSGRIAWWMKYHIFAPILMLQLVNLFWCFFIWRVLIRILFVGNASDVREEGEDESEAEEDPKIQEKETKKDK